MKKSLFISLLILATNLFVRAQPDTSASFRNALFKSGKVSFGLKFGYTRSSIYGGDINYIFADAKTTPLSAYHFGITVNSMLGKYFWLKHELLVDQRGSGVTLYDSINGNYTSAFKMLSLNILPASLAFHFKGVQVYAGPYVSVLLNAQITKKDEQGKDYQDHSIFGDGSQFETRSKYIQKLDYGINIGLEYQFPFGVFIGAKYMQGFADVFQYANSYTFSDPKKNISIYNRSVLISVGYSFLKK